MEKIQINVQIVISDIQVLDSKRGGVSRAKFAKNLILLALKDKGLVDKAIKDEI